MDQITGGPPLVLNPGLTVAGDISRDLASASLVSVAILEQPAGGASNDVVDVATGLLDLLPSIQKLDLSFTHSFVSQNDSTRSPCNIVQSASLNLRHVTIRAVTTGTIISLLKRAQNLEFLALGLYSMPGAAGSCLDAGSDALAGLRRLVVWTYTFDELDVIPQIITSCSNHLSSLSIPVRFQQSLRALQLNTNVTDGLVHLDLMAHYYALDTCFGLCNETRSAEMQQACGFIHACPRLAHLSLQRFHAEELTAILDAVKRPLLSLAVDSKRCYIATSAIIRPFLDRKHLSVARLRLLALDRPAVDTDWMSVQSLCRQRRITMCKFDECDLVRLLGRFGIWRA